MSKPARFHMIRMFSNPRVLQHHLHVFCASVFGASVVAQGLFFISVFGASVDAQGLFCTSVSCAIACFANHVFRKRNANKVQLRVSYLCNPVSLEAHCRGQLLSLVSQCPCIHCSDAHYQYCSLSTVSHQSGCSLSTVHVVVSAS